MGMYQKFVLIASSFAALLFYQNCGREQMVFVDSVVNDNFEYFNYNYKTVTEVYFNVNVIPQVPSGGLKEFLIVGGVAPSDSDNNASISWEIRMLDEAGRDICPRIEGSNQKRETLIDGSCTTPDSNKAYALESRVLVNGREYFFTQSLKGL